MRRPTAILHNYKIVLNRRCAYFHDKSALFGCVVLCVRNSFRSITFASMMMWIEETRKKKNTTTNHGKKAKVKHTCYKYTLLVTQANKEQKTSDERRETRGK